MAETLQRDEIIVREIVDTARVLFRKSGFKKTTMGDIARSLGKAKSSLYYYYPSKEDIFEAVIYAEMDELLDEIHQAISEATSSKGKLTAYCRCRLDRLELDPIYFTRRYDHPAGKIVRSMAFFFADPFTGTIVIGERNETLPGRWRYHSFLIRQFDLHQSKFTHGRRIAGDHSS